MWSRRVASKRHAVQARTMFLRGFGRLRRFLSMGRRERALLAKLDATRAGMATVADVVRDLSARQDAYAHFIHTTARASRGAMTETATVGSVQNALLTHAADALARSKATAEALDRVTDALERLGAALRDV
jgi:hypothetical protein